ncbi:MAG: sigma-70 family RNA polymerase sigma factor [Candidatus Doudnabacteria bacterium]|nr:sigma-70 family RNA polymerase sigma factor [Candidatus Doudnabacteria bacterium]
MTEEELNISFNKAKSADQEAFARIYDFYSEPIYKFIFFRTGHKEVAEDILSDTFVKAWLKISQVNSAKALSTWLYQIAKNNIIDYYRVRKSQVCLDEVEEFLLEDGASAIDELNLDIEQRKIVDLVASLPKDQQQIIRYRFFEDLTNEEIALLMNKTEGSVRVIQHRAILKLKTLLNRKKKT